MLNQPRSPRAFAPGTIEYHRAPWGRRAAQRMLWLVLRCILVLAIATLPFWVDVLLALLQGRA